MAKYALPRGEQLFTSELPSGLVRLKKVEDIKRGDFVWCFKIKSYQPSLTGHFEFIPVLQDAQRTKLKCHHYRWHNQVDGQEILVPHDLEILEDNFASPGCKFSFPGYNHLPIQNQLGLGLFSSVVINKILNEELAYFLGSWSVRPECYTVQNDTWAVFHYTINQSGEYGVRSLRTDQAAMWMKNHIESIEKIVKRVWSTHDYFIESKLSLIGLEDRKPPASHLPSIYLKRAKIGFAIHAKIGKGVKLKWSGQTETPDIREIQFWYSALESELLERASSTVRRSFLLGAFDRISQADQHRKSLGIDMPEGFLGSTPTFSLLHKIGNQELETFDERATSNPRENFEEDRKRGKMARCQLYDALHNVGFISELRLNRALKFSDLSFKDIRKDFPTPNALSVILGVPVRNLSFFQGIGSFENELSSFPLFKTSERATKKDVYYIKLGEEGAFPCSRMPLGFILSETPKIQKRKEVAEIKISSRGWENEILEKIKNINHLLPSEAGDEVPNDKIFEYLICCILSKIKGCSEAWVIRRHEDKGVDVGATFSTLDEKSYITVLVQAKLQSSSVGRQVVDQLRGALQREKGSIGFVFTNYKFSAQAKQSSESDYPIINLIKGTELVKLMIKHKIGINKKTRRYYFDVGFFFKLKKLIMDQEKQQGRVRIRVDQDNTPRFY